MVEQDFRNLDNDKNNQIEIMLLKSWCYNIKIYFCFITQNLKSQSKWFDFVIFLSIIMKTIEDDSIISSTKIVILVGWNKRNIIIDPVNVFA